MALNKRVIDEAWSRYGHCKSFAGWYISQECSRNTGKIVDVKPKRLPFFKAGKELKDMLNAAPLAGGKTAK